MPVDSTTAPIERVTVPLRPRTPAGCCDLAVMFYGRHVAAALRLYVAVAGPSVVLVYGFGRFVGTDLALAVVTGIVVSKSLGLLTVAATVRRTFGGPFELPAPDRRARQTRFGQLREVTRSVVTAAAVLAAAALLAALIDDAYGTGRLAGLGPNAAAVIVLILTAVLLLRGGLFVAERFAPGSAVWGGLVWGTLLRILLASPLALLFFDQTRTTGIVVAVFWLPAAAGIAVRFSFLSERRALSEIDFALHTPHAVKAFAFGEMTGPASVIVVAVLGLWVVALFGAEFTLTVLGLPGPLSNSIRDSLDLEFFEPGMAYAALGRSPLFAATVLASGLFAYQLGRIAWYFAYLDARVRRDCWDMELLLTREARRLEEQ